MFRIVFNARLSRMSGASHRKSHRALHLGVIGGLSINDATDLCLALGNHQVNVYGP